MISVTGLTAARMEAIEAASIVDAEIVDGELILTTHGGTPINVGQVVGEGGGGGGGNAPFHIGADLPETFSDGDTLYWLMTPPDGPPGSYKMRAFIASGMTGPGGPDVYMWVFDGATLMGDTTWQQRWADTSSLDGAGIFPLNIPHVASGYGFTWYLEYGFTGTGTMKPVTSENVFYPGTDEGAGAVGSGSSAVNNEVMAAPGSGGNFTLDWEFSGGGSFSDIWYRLRPGYFLMDMV